MKRLIRNTATAVIATIVCANVNAQVKIGGTVTSATKVTANTTKVTNAATGVTKATTNAVKTTTKATTNAVKTTTNATVNAAKNVKVKAGTNATVNTSTGTNATAGNTNANTASEGEVKAGLDVNADGGKLKGKSEEVKETVVTEAHSIKETAKEERKDIKPGLNISNKTEANSSDEVKVNGQKISGKGKADVQSETEVKADAKDKVKQKTGEVKEKAKDKAGETKEKIKEVKNTPVKAEGKVEANGKVQAGKQ